MVGAVSRDRQYVPAVDHIDAGRAVEVIAWIAKFLGGNVLDRVLDTIDRTVDSDVEKRRIKADVIKTHMQNRGDYLRSGGLFLVLLYAVPASLHFSAVVVYSILWCADCAWPQPWTIAALPATEAQYARWTALASLGLVGVARLRR